MVMLVGLGFLSAALLGLFLAPLYRRRSGRLAIEVLKRSMPLTEAEIRADKDRVRAEYAILIHKLEMKVDEAADAAARQKVELNRRDAAISELEEEVGRQRTFMEEHENARRVLEQTIMDRLPKVEYRLAEAKKLLFQRDREIVTLSQSSEKQARALEEAKQINTQQTDEIHRLKAALNTRAARKREGLGDPRFDGEVALRTEIESLRAETRDQSALIARLQAMLVRVGPAAQGGGDRGKTAASNGTNDAIRPARVVGRRKGDRSQTREPKLVAVKSEGVANEADNAKSAEELRKLKTANQDQAAEISRLKAALETYEAADKDERGVKESKIALKARLSALKALSDEQSVTIQSLRAEVAAGNERLARQAAYFMEEMRRLGGGTVPASGSSGRRSKPPARSTSKRPLVERINETGSASAAKEAEEQKEEQPQNPEGGGGFLKALGGASSEDDSKKASADAGKAPGGEVAKSGKAKPERKARLLERITGVEK